MSSFRERGSKHGDRHGWNDLDHYLNIHFAQLERLGEYFVESHDLEIYLIDENTLRIEGRVLCQHDVFLDVVKTLDINEHNRVRTIRYKYHAGLVGDQDRAIFRYDNAHPYAGHEDEHHKHVFDPHTWHEIGLPQWVGYEQWPTLADVLDELLDWWNEVGAFL